MATQNKPVLGYRQCPDCETRGSVHEAAGKRSGRLYQRCECGADQRSGAWVQTRLWYETDWLDGLQPEMPDNVYPVDKYLERFGERQAEPAKNDDAVEAVKEEAEEAEAGVDGPAPVDGQEVEQDTEPKPKKTGRLWLLVGGIAAGALALMAGG